MRIPLLMNPVLLHARLPFKTGASFPPLVFPSLPSSLIPVVPLLILSPSHAHVCAHAVHGFR